MRASSWDLLRLLLKPLLGCLLRHVEASLRAFYDRNEDPVYTACASRFWGSSGVDSVGLLGINKASAMLSFCLVSCCRARKEQ